jgi:hypothetical protein
MAGGGGPHGEDGHRDGEHTQDSDSGDAAPVHLHRNLKDLGGQATPNRNSPQRVVVTGESGQQTGTDDEHGPHRPTSWRVRRGALCSGRGVVTDRDCE